jgi:signal transduction histidine kinase
VDGRLGAIRAYCGVILRNPAGLALGTLCVFDERPRLLEAHQVRGLQLLARQVVDQLELRLRTREVERSHQLLAVSQGRLAAFAGQVSHDLKAPITAILGFSELLGDLDAVAGDPSAAGYVERCASSARRMRAMIDELLAFARVGGSLTAARVDLASVMAEVLDDLAPLPDDATVEWAGPPLIGDRQQLRALLQNLVGNALNYRDPAVPALVRVITERTDDGLVLRVTDNGPGIPPDRREDVLRPLVRLRTDVDGAGLGLAVCVRIAAAHGARLRVEDGPGGRGTTMTVVFRATPPSG